MPMEPMWVQCCTSRHLRRCDKCGSQNLRFLVAVNSEINWLTCDDCAHVFESIVRDIPKASSPHDAAPTVVAERSRLHSHRRARRYRITVLTVFRWVKCHVWTGKRVSRPAMFARLFLALALVAITQTRLDSARWWCSPEVVSALTITPEQAAVIERLYEDSLPGRRQTSEQAMRLTVRVADLIHQGMFGGELLRATEELAGIRAEEGDIRRHTFAVTARVLTRTQRAHLARLLAQHQLME